MLLDCCNIIINMFMVVLASLKNFPYDAQNIIVD